MHVKQTLHLDLEKIQFLSTSSFAIQPVKVEKEKKKQESPASLASNPDLEFNILLQTVTAFKSNRKLIITHTHTHIQYLAWQTMVSNFQLYAMKVLQFTQHHVHAQYPGSIIYAPQCVIIIHFHIQNDGKANETRCAVET